MTTQQIRYFLEVAKQLSFTKAAQCLFISQSTLSKQIASMESELGMQLFRRCRHSVSLTPAGLLLRAELGKVETSLALALDSAICEICFITEEQMLPLTNFLNCD